MNPNDKTVDQSNSVSDFNDAEFQELVDNEIENLSDNSHTSDYCEPLTNSGVNSELDTSPLRVRDMINLYNLATQKNQELSAAKSIYFGINKYGSHTNAKQFVKKVKPQYEHRCEPMSDDAPQSSTVSTKNYDKILSIKSDEILIKSSESYCGENTSSVNSVEYISEPNEITTTTATNIEHSSCNTDNIPEQVKGSRIAADTKNASCSCHNTKSKNRSHRKGGTIVNTKHSNCNCQSAKMRGFRIISANGQASIKPNFSENGSNPIEIEYESRTTVRKTGQGVRIIIDILCERDQTINIDVQNSCVETDIPESRIIKEFQQYTLEKLTEN